MIAIWIWGGFGFLECADWWCVVGWGGVLRGPTHVPVCFRPPSWRPSYFSLACPKRSNQEKGTLAAAVVWASCPNDSARTLRRFADGTSVCRQRTRAHLRAPLRAFSCAASPRPRGDPGARARPSWPQKPGKATRFVILLLTLGPSVTRRRADGRGPRAPHAGEREGSRSFGCGTRMCRQPNPGRP